MKTIPLTHGHEALVDDEDYERLSKHVWHSAYRNNNIYARTNINTVVSNGLPLHYMLYMHRMVLELYDPDVLIDHRNRNGLDNQKHNLRIADTTTNNLNSRTRIDSTTKVRGITFNKRRQKYRARITRYYKLLYDQYFDTLVEAEAAIIEARKALE